MELATTSNKRRSRVRRQSASKAIVLSPRDVEIFKLLDRYRYLPSNFIHAFVGGNAIRFKQRIGDLFHEGFLNRPYRQWQAMNARYRPAIYELDAKAREVLIEHGIRHSHRVGHGSSFAHEMMVCLVMASFELAARSDPGLRFISWRDLLAGAPAETRQSENPFSFPVAISYGDGRFSFDLKPDGRPFGFEYYGRAGTRRGLFFPGIEVDRHTEPLTAFDLERSSIVKKVLAYREVVATAAYKSQFSLPNMLVPIVTVNVEHMRNMIQLVLSLTKGKGASYLLFKTIPDFVSVDRTIAPDHAIITEPWHRAGHPPLEITKELRAA